MKRTESTETQNAVMDRHGTRLPGAWPSSKGLPLHAVWLGVGRAWQCPDAATAVRAGRDAYEATRPADPWSACIR